MHWNRFHQVFSSQSGNRNGALYLFHSRNMYVTQCLNRLFRLRAPDLCSLLMSPARCRVARWDMNKNETSLHNSPTVENCACDLHGGTLTWIGRKRHVPTTRATRPRRTLDTALTRDRYTALSTVRSRISFPPLFSSVMMASGRRAPRRRRARDGVV